MVMGELRVKADTSRKSVVVVVVMFRGKLSVGLKLPYCRAGSLREEYAVSIIVRTRRKTSTCHLHQQSVIESRQIRLVVTMPFAVAMAPCPVETRKTEDICTSSNTAWLKTRPTQLNHHPDHKPPPSPPPPCSPSSDPPAASSVPAPPYSPAPHPSVTYAHYISAHYSAFPDRPPLVA